MPGAECWHFQEATGYILNGSKSALGVEPTKLSLEEIIQIVKDGITGILTEPDNPELSSEVIAELLKNERLRTGFVTAAIEQSMRAVGSLNPKA